MRLVLFTLMSVISVAAISATVYKWVDENGVIHYSDQPHENAEKVELTSPQTYKGSSRTPARANTQPQSAAVRSGNNYDTCAVVSPSNDETLPNTFSVATTVQVNPAPHGGDQLIVLFDGKRVPNFPAAGGYFTFTEIDRGTHTLQALVQDAGGRVLCQSPSVSFTVLQASVLNPANPSFKH